MASTRATHFPIEPISAGVRAPSRIFPKLHLTRVLAGVLLGAGVLGGIEGVYLRRLSGQVGPLFEAELWAFPSKVYSRPLVLRRDYPIDHDELVARLTRLGYTESAQPFQGVGQFRSTRAGLEISTRGVTLPSGAEPPRRARVTFSRGTVRSLSEPSGRSIASLVLEPEVLATLTGDSAEDRTVLRLPEFPKSLVDAVITTEDRRFFEHSGIDPWRIVRAIVTNVRRGGIVQGASTITQQTVKNLFLGSERTWTRKIKEAHLALALEARFSKERILEAYLNEVYLGQRDGIAICGFGEAARRYFGKDARDLSLAESALLAGMIRSPAATNPLKHLDRAVARRNAILKAMLDQGAITEDSYRVAVAEAPRLAKGSAAFRNAPAFVQFVRKQLRDRYSERTLTHGGIRVYTTLDTHLQTVAEQAVRRGLEKLEKEHPRLKQRGRAPIEGAMVVLNPRTGEILALVGGRDFSQNQFDHALLAHRQPGSLFKPFVYLAGFERTAKDPEFLFTPATVLDDSPIEIFSGNKVWRPQDYDEEFRGPVTVRQALEESINVPAVRASQEIGLDEVASVARASGINLSSVYPSLALGAQQVTVLEMARAYSMIASGGYAIDPVGIVEVADRQGGAIDRVVPRSRLVADAAPVYLTLDLMRGVLSRGTAGRARGAGIEGDFAGKTGTTNDKRDAWFIGFSPEILAAVWVGYDDNRETGLTGATGALPIWIDFIRSSGQSFWGSTFREPEGITHVQIDPRTGGLATGLCPEVFDEVFLVGTEPSELCPEHGYTFEGADGLVSEAAYEQRPLRSWRRPSEIDDPRLQN